MNAEELHSRQKERLLKTRFGRGATYRWYDRTLKTPMNFVLDALQPKSGEGFEVLWIDGGMPELVCLTGLGKPIVAYNTRYIELLYLLRKLLMGALTSERRRDVTERTALRVMSEFALRNGQGTWAVRAFLRAVVGEGVQLLDLPGAALLDLEHQPIREAYMAIWFFGLMHEVGHLHQDATDALHLPDSLVHEALEHALDEAAAFPAEIRAEVLATASSDANHILAPGHLRAEVEADVFAAATLMQSTIDITEAVGEQFRVELMVIEVIALLNAISLLERCRTMANCADAPEAITRAEAFDQLLHPIAFAVRTRFLHGYLGTMVAGLLHATRQPNAQQCAEGFRLVDEICEGLEDAIEDLDSGLARAMRFALFPAERGPSLMTEFARELASPGRAASAILETEKLLSMAAAFEVESDGLNALRRLVRAQRRDARGS